MPNEGLVLYMHSSFRASYQANPVPTVRQSTPVPSRSVPAPTTPRPVIKPWTSGKKWLRSSPEMTEQAGELHRGGRTPAEIAEEMSIRMDYVLKMMKTQRSRTAE